MTRRTQYLIGLVVGIAVVVGAIVLTRDSDSADPKRQERIERMDQYQVTINSYTSGWDQMTKAEQAAAEQAVRPIAAQMCELAKVMPEADIETMPRFTMQLYQCWDPLTHDDG